MTSQLHTLMNSDLLILGAVLYMNTYTIEANLFIAWADSVKPEYPYKIQTRAAIIFPESSKFHRLLDENIVSYNFLWFIWMAFTICFNLIIVWVNVSCAVFLIQMVNHFLSTNPYKKVGNMPVFVGNGTHLLTRTQDKKFEDVSLFKIARIWTTLMWIPNVLTLQSRKFPVRHLCWGYWLSPYLIF